ncbi:MAG: hypothetical protein QOH63_514 [Acidobacteriota bacterium]|jgi:hypothetical protein|nr:hypothetical protein [Acidobacteriota bacterium]
MGKDDYIADALDIVNCAQYFEEIEEGEAYLCPAEGGAYSHKPCRFFGLYRNKNVESVANIEAVVDVSKTGDKVKAEVLWENSGQSEAQLQKTAIERALRFRPTKLPIRVFILANRTPTDFVKDSKGGMQTSKMYLDMSSLKAKDAEDLAAKLQGKKWSNFKFYSWK